jgi:hypothetical protein
MSKNRTMRSIVKKNPLFLLKFRKVRLNPKLLTLNRPDIFSIEELRANAPLLIVLE